MSRSYKKNACQKHNDKFYKNYANRRLRRRKITEDSIELNHKQYCKYTCSWNISDWKWMESKEESLEYANKWFGDKDKLTLFGREFKSVEHYYKYRRHYLKFK